MEELPAELLARIFSFLDARTLLRVSCCCTRTHELAMSLSSLWKAFYAAEFGETPPSAAPPPQTNEPQQQDIKAASIARFQSQALALRQRWHLLAATLRQQQQNTPNEPAQQQRKGELEANEAAKGSWKVMKEKAVAASAWPPLRSKQDLWNKKKNGSQELHLLVLGLRGAGKSSMFHQLQKSYTCTTPCLDFSVQRASVSGLSFLSLDVDNAKLIPIWRHYYTAVCALIFVVDVSNRSCPSGLPRHSQLELAAQRLRMVLLQDALFPSPVLLVFANHKIKDRPVTKTDISGATETAIEALSLKQLPPEILWQVQPCCMTNGHGLLEGLSWLVAVFNAL
ncbi:GTP-binding protein SAR1a [Balamuthia mandrillaris]